MPRVTFEKRTLPASNVNEVLPPLPSHLSLCLLFFHSFQLLSSRVFLLFVFLLCLPFDLISSPALSSLCAVSQIFQVFSSVFLSFCVFLFVLLLVQKCNLRESRHVFLSFTGKMLIKVALIAKSFKLPLLLPPPILLLFLHLSSTLLISSPPLPFILSLLSPLPPPHPPLPTSTPLTSSPLLCSTQCKQQQTGSPLSPLINMFCHVCLEGTDTRVYR